MVSFYMIQWVREVGVLMLSSRAFGAKVLLFGEYSVIRKSNALALPYSLFDGHLVFQKDKNRSIDPELQAFSKYMKRLLEKDELGFEFDDKSFSFDISGGLIFDSSIPPGYGVGSSGALCAAVFERYAKISDKQRKDIKFLKDCFSRMESHFHGSSSGIDPIISYLNSAILISDSGNLSKVEIPIYEKGNGAIFLLNTGRTRRTEPLVNLFLEKCSSKDFAYLCDRVLSPISNRCIDHFLSGDTENLYKEMEELSTFQFEHFRPMIPNLFQELWEVGLKTGNYHLKLCGAGGGGFLLGITRDMSRLSEDFCAAEVRPLFHF